jgi:hypothetical protein
LVAAGRSFSRDCAIRPASPLRFAEKKTKKFRPSSAQKTAGLNVERRSTTLKDRAAGTMTARFGGSKTVFPARLRKIETKKTTII